MLTFSHPYDGSRVPTYAQRIAQYESSASVNSKSVVPDSMDVDHEEEEEFAAAMGMIQMHEAGQQGDVDMEDLDDQEDPEEGIEGWEDDTEEHQEGQVEDSEEGIREWEQEQAVEEDQESTQERWKIVHRRMLDKTRRFTVRIKHASD